MCVQCREREAPGRLGSLSQIVTLGTLETMIAARFSNHLTGTVSSPHVYLLQ